MSSLTADTYEGLRASKQSSHDVQTIPSTDIQLINAQLYMCLFGYAAFVLFAQFINGLTRTESSHGYFGYRTSGDTMGLLCGTDDGKLLALSYGPHNSPSISIITDLKVRTAQLVRSCARHMTHLEHTDAGIHRKYLTNLTWYGRKRQNTI